jgi:glycine/D-amino acid oxidase-like deaminating enzyme/nitrite reductase/ring-hydroxylating ferredoxin subunit
MKENGHETVSFWQAKSSSKSYPPLQKDLQTDVCIIGAGIAGLTTAYQLSASGKKVVVLDDGPIGYGQTVRTTGHLSNMLDDRYVELESYFGEEGSKLAAQSHLAAIKYIISLVKKHDIKCDLEQLDAYLFTPPKKSTRVLEKELDACRRAGLRGVEMVEKAPLSFFDTGPCLRIPEQAQFSPLPYLEKLCDLIIEHQGQIHCHVHAMNIEEKNNRYIIETDCGYTVEAKHVVVATNSPINSRVLPHLKQAPYRTYVIAGKIPINSVPHALYYDTEDPYHYMRTAPLDNTHDLLIVGGDDHRTGEQNENEKIYKKLLKWTQKRVPEFKEIHYHWSGQVLDSIDSLAYIGRMKKDSEVYIVTGDSGSGITHGTIAGILINDLIHHRKNPWEQLYDPHRKTIKAAKEFAEENLNTLWQYRDWLTPGEIRSEKELKKNEGAIIRKGLKKCAVYCDKEGKLHEMSAVCPHLGALVRWNGSEHCWECPAHGSRFTADGKVIQGPANCNLNECC